MPKVTTIQPNTRNKKKKLRVAAYCRVSTDSEAQLESLETQMAHYEKYINDHSNWEYVGLYYDASDIIGLKQNPTKGHRFSPIFLFYDAI